MLGDNIVTLQSPYTCLRTVYCRLAAAKTTISLLSTFHSITTCMLGANGGTDFVNLQPLPQLTSLAFQRQTFMHLDAAAHLTALELHGASVDCSQHCCCVTLLLELSVYDALLVNFHHEGLSACLRLQSLTLWQSIIESDSDDECWVLPYGDNSEVPSGLFALKTLTRLELDYNTYMFFWFAHDSFEASVLLAGNQRRCVPTFMEHHDNLEKLLSFSHMAMPRALCGPPFFSLVM